MSVAFELIEQGILPEEDFEGAIEVIIGFPIPPMEKKYIFLDYCNIYGFVYTQSDVTRATGRDDI